MSRKDVDRDGWPIDPGAERRSRKKNRIGSEHLGHVPCRSKPLFLSARPAAARRCSFSLPPRRPRHKNTAATLSRCLPTPLSLVPSVFDLLSRFPVSHFLPLCPSRLDRAPFPSLSVSLFLSHPPLFSSSFHQLALLLGCLSHKHRTQSTIIVMCCRRVISGLPDRAAPPAPPPPPLGLLASLRPNSSRSS